MRWANLRVHIKGSSTSRDRRLMPVPLLIVGLLLVSFLESAAPPAFAAPAATTTAVSCTPNSLAFSSYTKCTAVVKGASPTGTVAFSQSDLNFTSNTGTFSSSSCTLNSGGDCSVFFNFTATGCFIYCMENDFQLTASYGGDSGNLASSGMVKVYFHSCWFSECLYNTSPGGDFTDYVCAVGNNPTDFLADCKAADTDYSSSSTGYDLTNQGIEVPGAGTIASMLPGCVGMVSAIAFATSNGYASGSSPGQVDSAALLGACGLAYPFYSSGAKLSATFGGKPYPDGGLMDTMWPLVTALSPAGWTLVGGLAVALNLGCGFVNYYCYGANITAEVIANPYNLQTKHIPLGLALGPIWGDPNSGNGIGWSLPSCTNVSFCTTAGSLCGPSGTTSPCVNPPQEGSAGQYNIPDLSHPDYSQINTNAPIECAVGHVNSLSIGYDGDVDFNVNSTNALPLVNPSNEKGGALGPPNGIVAEIPFTDRGSTTITPDGHPAYQAIQHMRVGTELRICGRWVTDTRDLWNELHPITFLQILPDFTVSASPSDVTIQAGEQASYTTTVTLKSGLSGSTPITLSVSGLPTGATGSFSVNPLPLDNPSTMTGTSTLTVTTVPSVHLGDFQLTITGTDQSGYVMESAIANLHVYDYVVSVTPADDTVIRGGTATYQADLTLLLGSTMIGLPAESLSATGVPGAAYTFGSPTLTPGIFGSITTLTVATAVPPGGALGDYVLAVTGTSPMGTARSGTANVHIYDFGITATVSPASAAYACTATPSPCLYVLDTGSNSYGISVQLTPGSSTVGLPQVGLSLSGAPAGTVYSFAPSLGTPTFMSNLTITTTNAPPGTYSLTITGTDSRSEGGTRSGAVSLVVLTPQQALQLVINQIEAYKSEGVITSGQANALSMKLQAAINYLNSGNTNLACLQLNAFTEIANSYGAPGYLRPAQSNLLLGGPLGVYAIMASIPC